MEWLSGKPHRRRTGGAHGVIDPAKMIPDGSFDLIGAHIAKIASIPNWNPTKQRLRDQLEKMATLHGYIGFEADYRDYQVTQVGQSFLYDVPTGKRGHLAPFAGKRVRIVCVYSGKFRRWVRVGVVSQSGGDEITRG